MKKNKAIFLDRDGVINHTVFRLGKERAPYSMDEFRFIDGVSEAISELRSFGFILIVVTNQPDVARGWVSLDKVTQANEFVKNNLLVHDLKACFHTEKDNCLCRKPKPGMLLEAGSEWNTDFSQSFMIGDRESDVEAGQAAGCRTILISSVIEETKADFQCRNLLQAKNWIKSELDPVTQAKHSGPVYVRI